MITKIKSIENIISIENIQNNSIFIYAHIIDACNYNCTYCYNILPRTKNIIDLNKLKYFIEQQYIKHSQNIILYILGGEPTLHPGLYDFCYMLKDYKFLTINIHSNFSQNLTYYSKFSSIQNVSFIFSYHYQNKEFCNKIFQLQTLVSENIFKKYLFVIMYEHFNIKYTLLLFKLLQLKKINSELSLIDVSTINKNKFKQYYYTNNDIKYACNIIKNSNIPNTIKIITKHNIFYINDFEYDVLTFNKKIPNSNIQYCSAGKTSYFIYSNEYVYPCADIAINNLNTNIRKYILDNNVQFDLSQLQCKTCGSTIVSKTFRV